MPSTVEFYTLSLHDALPISGALAMDPSDRAAHAERLRKAAGAAARDRKSTRLNSSHRTSSYADFCLKNKIQMAGKEPLTRPLFLTSCRVSVAGVRRPRRLAL